MNDCVKSVVTAEEAAEVHKSMPKSLDQAASQIMKWVCNSEEEVEEVSNEVRSVALIETFEIEHLAHSILRLRQFVESTGLEICSEMSEELSSCKVTERVVSLQIPLFLTLWGCLPHSQ